MLNPVNLYRLSNLLYRLRFPILPYMTTLFIRLIFACYIPYSANIGKNLILAYGGLGIILHGRVQIGNKCHLNQHVTIGGTSKKKEVPILGDNVYVGAGAKILGPVKIGDNVVVGANAVVLDSIPSNSLAVGVPAKVVKTGINKSDYV